MARQRPSSALRARDHLRSRRAPRLARSVARVVCESSTSRTSRRPWRLRAPGRPLDFTASGARSMDARRRRRADLPRGRAGRPGSFGAGPRPRREVRAGPTPVPGTAAMRHAVTSRRAAGGPGSGSAPHRWSAARGSVVRRRPRCRRAAPRPDRRGVAGLARPGPCSRRRHDLAPAWRCCSPPRRPPRTAAAAPPRPYPRSWPASPPANRPSPRCRRPPPATPRRPPPIPPSWRRAGGWRRCCRGSPPRCATRSATTGWWGCRGPSEVDYLRSSPGTSLDGAGHLGAAATWWPPPARRRPPRRRWPGPGGATRRCSRPPPSTSSGGATGCWRCSPIRPPTPRARVEARAGAGAGHRRAGRADRRPPAAGAAAVSRARPRIAAARRRRVVAGRRGAGRLRPGGARAAHPDRRLVARAGPAWPARRWSPSTSPGRSPPSGLAEGLLVALARAADARAVARACSRRASRPARWSPATRAHRGRTPASSCGRWRRWPARPPTRWWSAPTLRDAEGRAVLDPEGHRRTFVATFSTVAAPPDRRRARSSPRRGPWRRRPQAGGEYVELLNLGEEPLDLSGWRLEKRTSAGSLAGCTVAAVAEALRAGRVRPPHRRRLGRPLPGRPAPCALHLRGLDAGGRPRRRPAAGGAAPRSGRGAAAPPRPGGRGAALRRPRWSGSTRWRPTQAANLACAVDEGTPGWCNSVTPPSRCP